VRIKLLVIIIVLKSNSQVDPGQVMGQEGQLELSQVNVRIKIIVITVLKHDSKVHSRQDLGYRSGGLTRVYPGQCKDKSAYDHSFKNQLWETRRKARVIG
jgi:hypothetical protein